MRTRHFYLPNPCPHTPSFPVLWMDRHDPDTNRPPCAPRPNSSSRGHHISNSSLSFLHHCIFFLYGLFPLAYKHAVISPSLKIPPRTPFISVLLPFHLEKSQRPHTVRLHLLLDSSCSSHIGVFAFPGTHDRHVPAPSLCACCFLKHSLSRYLRAQSHVSHSYSKCHFYQEALFDLPM
jgi:hypothetical protein